MGALRVSSEFAKLLTVHGEEKIMEVVQSWVKRCEWQRNRYYKMLKAKKLQAKKRRGGKK